MEAVRIRSSEHEDALVDSGTYTARLKLNRRGYWRVVAVPDYAPTAVVHSSPRYFRLR